jgi:hypothetical protein
MIVNTEPWSWSTNGYLPPFIKYLQRECELQNIGMWLQVSNFNAKVNSLEFS